MDAVPVTLGQEFGGYAAQVREGRGACAATLERSRPDPAGRHRRRHRAEHASRVRRAGAREARRRHRPRDPAAGRPVRGAGQPRRPGRGVGRAQVGRRVADQDRQRPALDGLGPARGPRRDRHPGAAEGLVDHARQGQPGDSRGGVPGLGAGDRQRHRDHRRRAAGQLRAERADPADGAKPAAVDHAARFDAAALRGRAASTASRPTSRTASAPASRRWRWPRRSTRTSATTARRRS